MVGGIKLSKFSPLDLAASDRDGDNSFEMRKFQNISYLRNPLSYLDAFNTKINVWLNELGSLFMQISEILLYSEEI